MKKVLAATAIAIAIAAPAHAKALNKSVIFPKELQGDWCTVSAHQDQCNYVNKKCRDEQSALSMWLGLDTYKVSDGSCILLSGRKEKKTETGFTYVAQMRCDHDGEPWKQRIDFKVEADVHSTYVRVTWFNKNFGKADDYGSERFSAINQCMIAKAKSMDACMANQGFVFCPDCQVFGNDGPACKDDDHLHSWCWEQDLGEAAKILRKGS